VNALNATIEGGTVPVQVTTIMLGVEDLDRSKKFYGEGLGCAIDQDYPNFVSFNLGEGSSSLALYQREAAAADAGVPSEGSGFGGVSFRYIVSSKEAVDDVMGKALAAGGDLVREAACSGDTSDISGTRTDTCGRSPDRARSASREVRQLQRWVPDDGDVAARLRTSRPASAGPMVRLPGRTSTSENRCGRSSVGQRVGRVGRSVQA
jgi:catechol 2,3-dioxygenase-like lactoylglutathione lyase family enzyme